MTQYNCKRCGKIFDRKYNYERPHSGKYCYGKTPYQTFLESKHIAIEKTIEKTIENLHMKTRLVLLYQFVYLSYL